jgi:hypothetical protein
MSYGRKQDSDQLGRYANAFSEFEAVHRQNETPSSRKTGALWLAVRLMVDLVKRPGSPDSDESSKLRSADRPQPTRADYEGDVMNGTLNVLCVGRRP